MGSLYRRKNGNWEFQFRDGQQRRRAVQLGPIDKRSAESMQLYLDRIVAYHLANLPFDSQTARWAAELHEPLASRLASLGLMERTEAVRLKPFLDDFYQMNSHLRPNTLKNYDSTIKKLVEFFGADRLMKTITAGDCDRWKAWMERERKLAPATISRDLKRAKQFFRSAKRSKLIEENPLEDMKTPAQVNEKRKRYISKEIIERILEECPNTEWRLLVSLCRFAGLRCPTEIVPMTWNDVLWDKDLFIVHCVKTERHGRETRLVPIFPEIRPFLEKAFQEAPEGAERIFSEIVAGDQNRRTRFRKIILRAGVEPWPKLFHNLRSSAVTDAANRFPPHVREAWFGHSEDVANKHYLQVLQSHIDAATGKGKEVGFLQTGERLG